MSFRITAITTGGKTTIRVEGRLGADGVPELRREAELAEEGVELDLSGLTSADAEGLRLLLELSTGGARLCRPSAYISQLLDEVS